MLARVPWSTLEYRRAPWGTCGRVCTRARCSFVSFPKLPAAAPPSEPTRSPPVPANRPIFRPTTVRCIGGDRRRLRTDSRWCAYRRNAMPGTLCPNVPGRPEVRRTAERDGIGIALLSVSSPLRYPSSLQRVSALLLGAMLAAPECGAVRVAQNRTMRVCGESHGPGSFRRAQGLVPAGVRPVPVQLWWG
jgi:hypothetical protein